MSGGYALSFNGFGLVCSARIHVTLGSDCQIVCLLFSVLILVFIGFRVVSVKGVLHPLSIVVLHAGLAEPSGVGPLWGKLSCPSLHNAASFWLAVVCVAGAGRVSLWVGCRGVGLCCLVLPSSLPRLLTSAALGGGRLVGTWHGLPPCGGSRGCVNTSFAMPVCSANMGVV